MSDVALVMGPTEERDGYHILRKRADAELPEFGTVRPLREGRPIDGEVIGLRRRKDHPFLFDVRSEFDPRPERRTGGGPPAVATERYRRGWEAIWGRSARADLN